MMEVGSPNKPQEFARVMDSMLDKKVIYSTRTLEFKRW